MNNKYLEKRIDELNSEKMNNIKHLKDDSLIEILNEKPLSLNDDYIYYFHQLCNELNKRNVAYRKFNFLYKYEFNKDYIAHFLVKQQERFCKGLIVTNREEIVSYLRLLYVSETKSGALRILSAMIDSNDANAEKNFLGKDYNSAFFMDYGSQEEIKDKVYRFLKTGHSVIVNTQNKENIEWDNCYNLKYELINPDNAFIKIYDEIK
jgi:hypothetical protein